MTRGQKICAFIEAYCKIGEGAQVGQPMKLMKLQKLFILSRVLYGPELGGSDTSSNELIKVMLDSSMRALRGAAKSIDIAVLDEAAAAVVKARLIYCIGVGGSSQIATYSVVLRGYFCAQMSA